MTWGGAAAIIAAIAFLILVIFIVLFIRSLTKTIDSVTETVDEVTKTLAILKKDVDGLSLEAQGLLNKSNTLLDDVNYKVAKIDPLFTAVGDVGLSLSEVNGATRDLVLNITNSANDSVEKVKTKVQSPSYEPISDQMTADKMKGLSRLGETARRLKDNHKIKKAREESEVKTF